MDALEDVSVRQLPTRSWGGAMNMALDATAAETVRNGGPASVRVYEWSPSTLSLGYAQDPETIAWDFCDREGIEVTRRPTGGGAIYHDAVGDISYSIVVPRDILPENLTDAYQQLCQPLLSTFAELGISVDFASEDREPAYEPACYLRGLHSAHDLVVSTAGGERKISGNAQHRQREVVVQHGSILYTTAVDRHLSCFDEPDATVGTFANRTTTVTDHADVTRETVISHLEAQLTAATGATTNDWADEELDRATELVGERFGAPHWIEHRPSPEA